MSKKNKYVLAAAVLFFLFFSFLFFIRENKKKAPLTDKVVVSVYCRDSALLLYLAEKKNFFAKEGIKVEIKNFPSKRAALDTLIEDKADVVAASELIFAEYSFSQPELRIFSVISELRFGYLAYDSYYLFLVTRQRWLHQNPRLAQRFVRSLVEAERALIEREAALTGFLKKEFDYSRQYMERVLKSRLYYVYLPQALLLELENRAAWLKKNKLVEAELPNYLDFIYPYALDVVDSLRVTMIR